MTSVRLAVISAGAAHSLVAAVAKDISVEVAGTFGAVGTMRERFLAGEACDLLILTKAQIAQLAAERRVDAASAADLGVVRTAIAVRVDQDVPDVADEARLRTAILAADALYFPDPAKATAGIHFVTVLEALGIHAAMRPRFRNFPNGATSMRELARSKERALGCTQATEIIATPGIKLVAMLPRAFELATVYTAAVSAAARDADNARAFISRLAGAEALSARRRAGFEDIPPSSSPG
jgi:molybdate transport system substrate-binding protein